MHNMKGEGLGEYVLKNIMEVKREELRDMGQIQIAKEKPVREKLERIISGEDDFTTHLNDGYVVRVHFGKENYSATDALKQYLRQISELKY